MANVPTTRIPKTRRFRSCGARRRTERAALGLLLGLAPVTALAETTGVGTSTGGDLDTDGDGATDSETDALTDGETEAGSTTGAPWEPIHDSTEGLPLWEGPRTNDPPIQIELDDDGFCRVDGPASGAGFAALLFLLGLARRRR